MLGVIANTVGILIGSLVGLLLKNGLSNRFKEIITNAIGLVAVFVGLSGSLSRLLLPETHGILFIVSLALGGVIGEALRLDKLVDALKNKIDSKFGGSGTVGVGFMNATLLFCIGAMPLIGAIEGGISGNHQTFFAKAIMDGISAIIFASTYGMGVLFSAVSVFLYQGILTLFSTALQGFLTADMIREFSLLGGIIVFCIGLNILEIKRIKIENFVPALFIPIVYYGVLSLFQ